jgi:hypothetical protein
LNARLPPMARRWLPCAALLVACAARPAGAPSTPATEPSPQPFHVVLPVLARAERAAIKDEMAEA